PSLVSCAGRSPLVPCAGRSPLVPCAGCQALLACAVEEWQIFLLFVVELLVLEIKFAAEFARKVGGQGKELGPRLAKSSGKERTPCSF
ncbi:MAG: hypothetical protein HUU21_14785, partial [Polyangiaceae bacterium]|nr:hypothetical protein [Polyangiaceae bacterium]